MEKGKVVVVMGATATGKSKLAVDLALRFGGEVINSDKIQVHDGLDVVTNKVTPAERRGVPHHLIGGVHPDSDYSVAEFRADATRAVDSVLSRGRVPIIAGGSNRYLEALLHDDAFLRRHECCFLWVDADDLPVLHRYIRHRVDLMLEQGLVAETRGFFRPDADYSRGIYRAIGVPEMDAYFRLEAAGAFHSSDDNNDGHWLREVVLAAAVAKIKANTCTLACQQRMKIHQLRTLRGWSLHRFDVTAALSLKFGDDVKRQDPDAWEADVAGPATRVVATFLMDGNRTKEVAAGSSGAAPDSCALQLEKAVLARGRSFVGLETPPAVV